MSSALKRHYAVTAFSSAGPAIDHMQTSPPDLVLLDIGLPDMDGIEALTRIKRLHPRLPVIMITAQDDVDTVIAAMKKGADDYIIKPIPLDALKVSIGNALETVRLRLEIQDLQTSHLQENVPAIIGNSRAIRDVMGFVEKVAQSPDAPVMIQGESGTGKELIARSIHFQSPNFKGPFVTVNCAAVPGNLFESELFGYEPGAFSGASRTGKKGLIEAASGGTLFLDEIGELEMESQTKLLRFMEDGEFYKVGGTRKQQVSVRIVSATNRDLYSQVEQKKFRLDLFYRLSVIPIDIPTLNERPEDIMPLAGYYLDWFCRKYRKPVQQISEDVTRFLMNHRWKGNIRELKNLIERGVLTGEGPELTLNDLGIHAHCRAKSPCPSPKIISDCFPDLPDEGLDLPALERHLIRQAYRKTSGSDVKSAKLLNMNYYTYRYRRKKLSEA